MPVLWCFSFTLFNVEEFRGKKRRRKERKRDRVRASYLWTSDVSATALAQPLSLLHALWSHEVKKEDWPFLPRIHAQGFALFINFLSTCVQTVGAPFVHYFTVIEWTYLKSYCLKNYNFCRFFDWFLKLDWTCILQSLKTSFDYTAWTMSSTYCGPDTPLNSLYSLTHHFLSFIEVSTPLCLPEKEAKAQRGNNSRLYSK